MRWKTTLNICMNKVKRTHNRSWSQADKCYQEDIRIDLMNAYLSPSQRKQDRLEYHPEYFKSCRHRILQKCSRANQCTVTRQLALHKDKKIVNSFAISSFNYYSFNRRFVEMFYSNTVPVWGWYRTSVLVLNNIALKLNYGLSLIVLFNSFI